MSAPKKDRFLPAPPAWPADKVERRPVDALVPYARNARTHSDAQVAQIAASIREWGWTVPVLCDEQGGLIAGHGRVLAARKLGIADVPVMVARGWTEAQRRAYVLADNKLALNAGWNEDLLKIELADIQGADFELMTIGFDVSELADLIGGKDIEDTPPLSSATEIDPDAYEMGCKCPRCGFEFDAK